MMTKYWKPAFIAVAALAVVIVSFTQYRNAADFQERSNCAAFWLDKVKATHEVHLKDKSQINDRSQLELMNQIQSAYDCVTRPLSYLHTPHPSGRQPSGSFGQRGVLPQR